MIFNIRDNILNIIVDIATKHGYTCSCDNFTDYDIIHIQYCHSGIIGFVFEMFIYGSVITLQFWDPHYDFTIDLCEPNGIGTVDENFCKISKIDGSMPKMYN